MAQSTTVTESVANTAISGINGPQPALSPIYWPSQAVADKPWVTFLFVQSQAGVATPIDGTQTQVVGIVTLPMPASGLKVGYNVNYTPQELGVADIAVRGRTQQGLPTILSNIKESVTSLEAGKASGSDILNAIKNIAGTGAGLAATSVAETFGGLLGDQAMNIARALNRQRLNPRLEQLYQNVDYRSFTYQWLLAPQSPEESARLDQIVRMFKYAMLPAYTAPALIGGNNNDGAFAYPFEFNILYFNSTHLFQPLRCALTRVDVDYAPQGLAFFREDDGNTDSGSSGPGIASRPAAVSLSLQFTELQLLTRDQFAFDFASASGVNATTINQSPSANTRTYFF